MGLTSSSASGGSFSPTNRAVTLNRKMKVEGGESLQSLALQFRDIKTIHLPICVRCVGNIT